MKTEAAAAATAAGATSPTVALEAWLECNGNKDVEKAWADSCPAGQQTARYITITISSSFSPSFGTAGYPEVNADGTVPITASASLRVQ